MTGAGSTSSAGVVHWITGLPCSGKTVVGTALAETIRAHHGACALLDGDALRDVLAPELGHSRPERLRIARSYGELSRLLADQGLPVVVCTVSMFEEVWAWNRRNLALYFEILLVADETVRRARDTRGVYEGREVPGVDLRVDEPRPDLRLENDGQRRPVALARQIWERSPLRGWTP